MTRKRRFGSRLAPLAPAPATPARSTRSNSSATLVLATPPAAPTAAAATATALLSPPPKKRVRRGGFKAPSLADALDDCDAAVSAVPGDVTEAEVERERHDDVKPDPNLPEPYKRSARVLLHKGSVYDAMLTRARVHQNQCEFIALQALEHDAQFYLWTRSGTVGYTGKTLLVGPYESAERVVVEFCNMFAAKTSCAWEERHSLQYQEGSYTWIELDHSMGTPYADLSSSRVDSEYDETAARGQKRRRSCGSRAATSGASASSRLYSFVHDWSSAASPSAASPSSSSTGSKQAAGRPASRLHAEVQAFMNLIADPSECQGYSYSETEDVMEEAQKMPLGRLSKTTIKRGYETLQKIYEALQARMACRTHILNLSSHFYSIIPHHARLDVIDTMVKLGKKVAMMESVCENVRGMSAVDVVNLCKQRNYLDECYDLLGCDLEPLDEATNEYAYVKAYLKSSSCCGWKDGTLQLLHVFRVSKPDEAERFAPYRAFPNRKILWHGSRMSNWLGILTDGLRIAPPDVASNGRIFGKGIYFTDKASKAQAYCHASSARHGGHSKCVFVLSEVALGDVKEMVASEENAKRWVHVSSGGHTKAAASFNSCKGVGTCRPDESGDVLDAEGAIWPLGKPVQAAEATGLSHSEYIIYNPAQARMRFVVVAKSAY